MSIDATADHGNTRVPKLDSGQPVPTLRRSATGSSARPPVRQSVTCRPLAHASVRMVDSRNTQDRACLR